MGTTFLRLGDCGFWMNNGVLEIWLRLLALHLEDPVESGSHLTKIRDLWLFASRGLCKGCVPVGLKEAVSTEEGNTIVRSVIHSLLKALKEAPPLLSKDMFNLMGFGGCGFPEDLEARRFIDVRHAFLDLLDGKITAGPSDTTFMPGCR